MTGALEMVLSQTERLDTLVASLLALAQPFQVQRQRIDLVEWIEERRQAHAELAEKKQLQLGTTLDLHSFAPGLSTSALDPVQMARALDNLLLNALAHCEAGGRIDIGARLGADGRLQLWVADDGPGVAPELRESLFDPFVSQRSGGTGLGLVLVREIVHAHGGSITLAATERGARFDMELPWRAS